MDYISIFFKRVFFFLILFFSGDHWETSRFQGGCIANKVKSLEALFFSVYPTLYSPRSVSYYFRKLKGGIVLGNSVHTLSQFYTLLLCPSFIRYCNNTCTRVSMQVEHCCEPKYQSHHNVPCLKKKLQA